MAISVQPLDRQRLTLAAKIAPGDSTFRTFGRFQKDSEVGSGTEFQIGSQILTISPNTDREESVYVDVTVDPITIDSTQGIFEYAIITNGIDSDNSEIPPTLSSTTNEKTHNFGDTVIIGVSAAYFGVLNNSFIENSSLLQATANGAITAGKSIYLDGSFLAVQGTSGGKFAGIATVTVADTEIVTYAVPGRQVTGITVPGASGDDVFAESNGDLTATVTGNVFVGTKSGSTALTVSSRVDIAELTQLQVENSTDVNFGSVSGERIAQGNGFIGQIIQIETTGTGVLGVSGMQALGWAICDGTTPTSQGVADPIRTEVTPDLVDKFLRGDAVASGTTGGSDTDSVTLITANLPAHNHQQSSDASGSLQYDVGAGLGNQGFQVNTTSHPTPIVTKNTGSNSPFNVDTIPSFYEAVFMIKVR